MSLTLAMAMLAVTQPAMPVRFACDIALTTPQRQFTAPTPVTVSFVVEGKNVRDIHVVDTGGILYPGANLKIVQTPEATRMDAVTIPAERPGTWTGKVEKAMYRLRLAGGAPAEWAEIGIGRKPAGDAGRFGLVWNASHKPEGLPQPITGSGGGSCTSKDNS